MSFTTASFTSLTFAKSELFFSALVCLYCAVLSGLQTCSRMSDRSVFSHEILIEPNESLTFSFPFLHYLNLLFETIGEWLSISVKTWCNFLTCSLVTVVWFPWVKKPSGLCIAGQTTSLSQRNFRCIALQRASRNSSEQTRNSQSSMFVFYVCVGVWLRKITGKQDAAP